jgi:3-oxoacyl-[acyl-carrier protein] reductase
VDLPLIGPRALVMGSSGGIGEAIARRTSAEGAEVVVHARKAENVHSVVESIRSRGGHASGEIANLADASACDHLISACLSDGPFDILVNNAGSFVNHGWDEATPEDWMQVYAINVAAVVRCVHGLMQSMHSTGWVRFIQIGSGEAVNQFPVMPGYSASKAAILNLTVSPSKHLAGGGITVNTVSPGIVVTPGVENFYRLEASRRGWGEDWTDIEAHILAEVLDNPTGGLGRPKEVAGLVPL